jgi:L-rhamnose mutarotase
MGTKTPQARAEGAAREKGTSTTMTEFVGLRTRLQPGTEAAYKEAHDAIWPELLEAQRAAGIKRWVIYRDGLDLFHHVEADDFDSAIAQLERDPVDQRWQAEMVKFAEPIEGEERPASSRLALVYNRVP